MKKLTHPKRKRRIKSIGWLLALTVIAWVSFLFYFRRIEQNTTTAIPVSLIEAKTGMVEDIINESGIIELEGQQTLKAPGDGTISQVLVKTGERFSSGQKLILLGDPERETRAYEQNLNLQKKQLALVTKEREVADSRIDLELKQKSLQNELELFQKGFISENQFQTQQEEVRQAKRQLSQAKQELSDAKLDLQLQELERTKTLAEQQKNLVTAPGAGKVLEVNVKRGDVVELGDSLLTIGNPQQQIIKLQISPLNATKIKLGQVARVSKIGLNSQVYTGRVESLSLIASTENNSDSNRNTSQPTVSATVKLDRPTQELIPGSQVSVDIVLIQRKDTIVLPTSAIIQNQGSPFVWVKSNRGLAKKQPVTLGLEGITDVEIVSGLNSGDKVILPSANIMLQPGTKVRSISN